MLKCVNRVMTSHDIHQLCSQLERGLLKSHVAGGVGEHEPEVNVYNVSVACQQQVAIVAVLDLYIYIQIHAYVYIRMYMHTYTHTYRVLTAGCHIIAGLDLYICTFIRACTRAYMRTYENMHTYTTHTPHHTHTTPHARARTHTHTHTHTRACMHISMRAYLYACMRMHTHTCILICTHTHTHTHTEHPPRVQAIVRQHMTEQAYNFDSLFQESAPCRPTQGLGPHLGPGAFRHGNRTHEHTHNAHQPTHITGTHLEQVAHDGISGHALDEITLRRLEGGQMLGPVGFDKVRVQVLFRWRPLEFGPLVAQVRERNGVLHDLFSMHTNTCACEPMRVYRGDARAKRHLSPPQSSARPPPRTHKCTRTNQCTRARINACMQTRIYNADTSISPASAAVDTT